MNAQTLLFSLLLFFFRSNLNAQSSVVVSGNLALGIHGTASYTVGDVFYTQKGKSASLSEGNQTSYKINPIKNGSNLHVSVFPNPSTDYLYFLVEDLNYTNLSYQIISISGNILQTGRITNQKSFAPLNQIPNGEFIVKINRDDKEMKSYKIFKIN